jgi:hypothetical protein
MMRGLGGSVKERVRVYTFRKPARVKQLHILSNNQVG